MVLRLFNAYVESASKSSLTAHRRRTTLGKAGSWGTGSVGPCVLKCIACRSEMTLEGRLIPGLQLGRLAMLQQRLRVGGMDFTLLMPSDKDVVYDLYSSAGGRKADQYSTENTTLGLAFPYWPSSLLRAGISYPVSVSHTVYRIPDCLAGLPLVCSAYASLPRPLTERKPQELKGCCAPAGLGDSDLFWTRLWPASIALTSFILARPELVLGKKVAAIGCGLGLEGIAAALAGRLTHSWCWLLKTSKAEGLCLGRECVSGLMAHVALRG